MNMFNVRNLVSSAGMHHAGNKEKLAIKIATFSNPDQVDFLAKVFFVLVWVFLNLNSIEHFFSDKRIKCKICLVIESTKKKKKYTLRETNKEKYIHKQASTY